LTDARIAFEQALVIKQSDPIATARLKTIDDKEKKQREADELENNYNSVILAADNSFKAGDYDQAKAEYTKALGLIKKSWPQEQLKNIDKQIAAQVTKDDTEKKKRLKQLEEEQLKKDKAETEANYKAVIKSADKYFKAKDYTRATVEYNKALSIDNQQWPQQQLKAIQKIKEQEEAEKEKTALKTESDKQAKERKKAEEKAKQAREKEYKAAVQDADKLFKKKDYTAAKDAYIKAAALTDDSWPQEQITKINKITDEQTALAIAEKLRLAQEAEATASYTAVIDKAKTEFDKGNYIKSRKLYGDAAALKPAEKLPKEKLALIQHTLDDIAAAEKARKDSLALAAETKKKYDIAMSKAKSYFLKDDLVNAKNAYTEASNMKPAEEEPKKQLKAIQSKLDIIAKENAVNEQYDAKIAIGDSLLIAKAYESAMAYYKEALIIKPSEYYPQTQLKYLQAEMRNVQKEKADNAVMEAYRREEELDQKYRAAVKTANQAVTEKKYDAAKVAYEEALTYRPDNDYAQQRLKIVIYQMEKEKLTKANELAAKKEKETNVTTVDKKEKSKPIPDAEIMKIAPIPYSPEELKTKYPGIDFTSLPPEQPFNQGAINTLDNANVFRQTLVDKPRLKLSETEHKVKLTCQAINFEGTSVYLKFLIENNDKTDFLTGAMMLTWTKKSGNRIKLYPNYLYPAFLPIIPPGKEAVIIYVCKSYYVNDNEKLNFELNDRLNKIKIDITIPGSVYNEEESRY
jgi:tetratricopeptide (TPR) repeat protein